MFVDRDAGAKQRGVDRTADIFGVVDAERVDPDECRPVIDQPARGAGGQKRVAFEILVGAPCRSQPV